MQSQLQNKKQSLTASEIVAYILMAALTGIAIYLVYEFWITNTPYDSGKWDGFSQMLGLLIAFTATVFSLALTMFLAFAAVRKKYKLYFSLYVLSISVIFLLVTGLGLHITMYVPLMPLLVMAIIYSIDKENKINV